MNSDAQSIENNIPLRLSTTQNKADQNNHDQEESQSDDL